MIVLYRGGDKMEKEEKKEVQRKRISPELTIILTIATFAIITILIGIIYVIFKIAS